VEVKLDWLAVRSSYAHNQGLGSCFVSGVGQALLDRCIQPLLGHLGNESVQARIFNIRTLLLSVIKRSMQ
jgi:hypothetical protein